MGMSANQRGECLEKSNWCPVYFVGTHKLSDCNVKSDSKNVCGVDGCMKHHHKSLHGGSSPFIASVMSTSSSNNPVSRENVLLLVQTIQSKEDVVNCLFDNAATCSLISEAAAKRLNLVGE